MAGQLTQRIVPGYRLKDKLYLTRSGNPNGVGNVYFVASKVTQTVHQVRHRARPCPGMDSRRSS
jgi:hypothetical protein